MRVGGGEGKKVGWGTTDRLCHCLSAPPAVDDPPVHLGYGNMVVQGGVGCRR